MPIPASFYFIFVLFSFQYQLQLQWYKLKGIDGVHGIRTRAAGWLGQTKPRSYGGRPTLKMEENYLEHFRISNFGTVALKLNLNVKKCLIEGDFFDQKCDGTRQPNSSPFRLRAIKLDDPMNFFCPKIKSLENGLFREQKLVSSGFLTPASICSAFLEVWPVASLES